jgi:hypothetical protein
MCCAIDLLEAPKHAAANCSITLILTIDTRACRYCFSCSCACTGTAPYTLATPV